MKTLILLTLLCTTQAFAQEGIPTPIPEQDIQEFTHWIDQTRYALKNAVRDAKELGPQARVEFMVGQFKKIVMSSGKKKYQQHMRYALNRGLLYVETLEKKGANELGIIQNQWNILVAMSDVALSFYRSDIDFNNDPKLYSQAEFGLRFVQKLWPEVEAVFNLEAQFQILKNSLALLQYDLSQDENSKIYAEEIVEIHNILQKVPESVIDEDELMKKIWVLNQLKIKIQKKFFPQDSTPICGQGGEIFNRIDDCKSQPDADRGDIVLVARNAKGQEVLKNIRTGVIWGPIISQLPMTFKDAKNVCKNLRSEVSSLKRDWKLPSLKQFQEAMYFPYSDNTFKYKDLFSSHFWTSTKTPFELYSTSGHYGVSLDKAQARLGLARGLNEMLFSVRCVAK